MNKPATTRDRRHLVQITVRQEDRDFLVRASVKVSGLIA
jgi:hypothetical protein